ncbi:hypothetical protein Dalk_0824 [Desulfatibacillum aliphaticivorans]|uniref:Penicillin-binding protein activator LpoB n=1 Tax=Desulfatibacillum aliphaticivorans TaxID=218208 RepID=B8FHW2_DESAL|nr:hypothetical protein [Desulfatibacillum aliphaticivorans]ACL02529.1 hypothetical protein Dalk_0824 [Desulfatibacillum aliphaticivorans]
MTTRFLHLICAAIVLCFFFGCVTTGQPQGRVAMLDVSERPHLDTQLNMTDLMALAEKLTNEMLMSDVVAGWGSKRPRLVISPLKNNSVMDNIPEEQVYDRIKGILLEAGVARIVHQSSNNYDYVLYGVLDSTQEYGGDGSEIRDFNVTLNLSTIDGEDLGRWNGRIKLAKGKRPLF